MSVDKLTEIVSVRFTADELARLHTLAGGRPISHVVRELATRSRPPTSPPSRPVNVAAPPVGWFTCNYPHVTVGIRPGIVLTSSSERVS